jgi:phosphatidylglycerophosphatase C
VNLALFDFDGTITSTDSFTPFLRFAASRPRLAFGTALLGPMIAAYRAGLIHAPRMRGAAAWVAFRGRHEQEVMQFGARYAETLAHQVRPRAREQLQWHQRNGDRAVVVSASLSVYLRPFCDALGVELICTELEAERGVLTGRYAGGDCTGNEKARRVLARHDLSRYADVYAYGDTEEDQALLALASKRFYRWRELPQSA